MLISRILIVDDEASIREVCTRALRPLGHTVETAGDAKQAMACFQKQSFDLLITDDRMPGPMSGLALGQDIKQRFPETQLILMTGFPTLENALSALQVGASDYLVKPFDGVELVDYVNRCQQSPGGIARPSYASTLVDSSKARKVSPQTLPKILLVDDSRVTLTIYKSFFEKSGYEVLTATDGEKALEIALEKKPGLMIVDGELPKMNGFEVCRQLRQHADMNGTKIIMFTGGIEGNEAQQAQAAGANRFVPKDTSSQALLAAAQELLEE